MTLLAVVVLTAASGASCPQVVQQYTGAGPRVLPPSPTLEQVIGAVNANSSQIRSFSTNYATVSVPGTPTLRASIAMERPRRFRLQATTTLTGAEVDLGSNDELFWFWAQHAPQHAVYFCRHDQFAQSNARQVIPIAPTELIEALGLVEFDPALPHQGPEAGRDGRLVIRTIRETDQGPTTKVTIVDAVTAWVVEQQILDAQNQLLLSSTAGQHRRDPASGLFMPKTVWINCPRAQFSMRVDLGNVQINAPMNDRADLWAMPNYQGSPMVDLADPNVRFTQVGQSRRFSK